MKEREYHATVESMHRNYAEMRNPRNRRRARARAPTSGLAAMASKGERKYRAKVSSMHKNYAAMAPLARANFARLPFGPTRKANYAKAWKYMVPNYKAGVTPEKASKWRRNWMKKMSV